MRPYSLKRTRNGKYKATRNRRMRPTKLRPREKAVVRAAVRRVEKKEEIKRSQISIGVAPTAALVSFRNEGSSWSTPNYRYSHGFLLHAFDSMNQGIGDNQFEGTSISCRSLVFDYLFSRGQLLGNVTYPGEMWVRVALIKADQEAATDGTWTQVPGSDFQLTDADFTGDPTLWVPTVPFDRRAIKVIKSRTFLMPRSYNTPVSDTISATDTTKHVRMRCSLRKKVQFEKQSITGSTTTFIKGDQYYWYVGVYAPYYVPSSNPDGNGYFPLYGLGSTFVYYNDS